MILKKQTPRRVRRPRARWRRLAALGLAVAFGLGTLAACQHPTAAPRQAKPLPPPAQDGFADYRDDKARQEYFKYALSAVLDHFHPPDAPPGLVCTVQFAVAPDGSVERVQVEHSTGYPDLDQVALKAIREACPLPTLPAPLAAKGALQTVIDFNFDAVPGAQNQYEYK